MVMERFIIESIVGDISLEIFFSTVIEEQDRDHIMSHMIEIVDSRFRVR